MKAEGRSIRKDGVQCFQRNWFYWHDRISAYKGTKVEVRYIDRDYGRVWVRLPDGDLCEARIITPTLLLNPNRETLKVVAQARVPVVLAGTKALYDRFTTSRLTEEVRAQLASRVGLHYLLPVLTVREVKSIIERALGKRRPLR